MVLQYSPFDRRLGCTLVNDNAGIVLSCCVSIQRTVKRSLLLLILGPVQANKRGNTSNRVKKSRTLCPGPTTFLCCVTHWVVWLELSRY